MTTNQQLLDVLLKMSRETPERMNDTLTGWSQGKMYWDIDLEILGEDYTDAGGEGYEPLSVYQEYVTEEEKEEELETHNLLPKGSLIFSVD